MRSRYARSAARIGRVTQRGEPCLPAAAGTVAAPAGTTSAVAPWRGRLGDFDGQSAASESRAVELSYCLVGSFGRGHLDEGEAPRPAAVTIGNNRDVLDAGDLVEELAQLLRGSTERKATDEKLLTHESSPEFRGESRALERRKRAQSVD